MTGVRDSSTVMASDSGLFCAAFEGAESQGFLPFSEVISDWG